MASASASFVHNNPNKNLINLPAEIIPIISKHLDYPDLLSLRLTHPYFYHSPLLNTDNDAGIRSRVAWLCSVGSFGPLEAIFRPKRTSFSSSSYSSSVSLSVSDTLSSLWNTLTYHPRLTWRTTDISSVCMRLRTNREFLSNIQVQRMLRLRIDHAACPCPPTHSTSTSKSPLSSNHGITRGCRVVPGTSCSGPRKQRCALRTNWFPVTHSDPTQASTRHSARHILNEVTLCFQRWRVRSILSVWDVLFLVLIATALVMPWSILVREVMQSLLGTDIGLHTAGFLVTSVAMMLAKSLLQQSKARHHYIAALG